MQTNNNNIFIDLFAIFRENFLEALIAAEVQKELARREGRLRVHVRSPAEWAQIRLDLIARRNASLPADYPVQWRAYPDRESCLRAVSNHVTRTLTARGIICER